MYLVFIIGAFAVLQRCKHRCGMTGQALTPEITLIWLAAEMHCVQQHYWKMYFIPQSETNANKDEHALVLV